MENASKALIMAASIFLGLMLLAIMIYMFRAGAKVNESVDGTQANNQLVLYNSKFENYNMEATTILDIITVANMAYDINTGIDYDTQSAIEIEIAEPDGDIVFKIPKVKGQLIERNTILNRSNNPISIYNLANSTLYDLGISITGVTETVRKKDKLTTTRFDNSRGKTIYKYLFSSVPNAIEYSDINGKITRMKFELYLNLEY